MTDILQFIVAGLFFTSLIIMGVGLEQRKKRISVIGLLLFFINIAPVDYFFIQNLLKGINNALFLFVLLLVNTMAIVVIAIMIKITKRKNSEKS